MSKHRSNIIFALITTLGATLTGCSSNQSAEQPSPAMRNIENETAVAQQIVNKAAEFCVEQVRVRGVDFTECLNRTSQYMTQKVTSLEAADRDRLKPDVFAAKYMAELYSLNISQIKSSVIWTKDGRLIARTSAPQNPTCDMQLVMARMTPAIPDGWRVQSPVCQ